MALDTKTITLYVRLLDEGTDVFRPASAQDLGGGLFRILATPDYDPDDEQWEFPPGSTVRAVRRNDEKGEYLVAMEGGTGNA